MPLHIDNIDNILMLFKNINGKEERDCSKQKRASLSTSQMIRASVTVEAAFILPFFLIVVITLLTMFELQESRLAVFGALQCAGQEAAYEDVLLPVYVPALSEGKVESYVQKNRGIGKIENGRISCTGSYREEPLHLYHMKAQYWVKPTFSLFLKSGVKQQVTCTLKGWNGYVSGSNSADDNTIVYVTENAEVYHKSASCTHLDLSVKIASVANLSHLRNVYGETYKACEHCGGGSGGVVYITDMGNRYHSDWNCSGLKRRVRAVPLREVSNLPPCSRCGN